MTSIATDLK